MNQLLLHNYLDLDLSAASPLFLVGDAARVLQAFPDQSIDVCMTSPPYWGQRQYSAHGIGLERCFDDYASSLLHVFAQVRRVLKDTGSFWLNIGDRYVNKGLVGMPWRIALRLCDEQNWILRNDVIWHKIKGGPDNSKDKLRNVHEHVFHLVKKRRGYYYDADAIRNAPRKTKVVKGAVVSATGVSGVRYRRQIELSTSLGSAEKRNALSALEVILADITAGRLSDFRMVIRGYQRTTHSDSTRVSGRAKELADKGYYFLKYNPNGAKPSDVWDIIPEDTQKRRRHFAAFPADLCKIPILATCPHDGVVLDPFCGTGTTIQVATQLGRRGIGIDLAPDYVEYARERLRH